MLVIPSIDGKKSNIFHFHIKKHVFLSSYLVFKLFEKVNNVKDILIIVTKDCSFFPIVYGKVLTLGAKEMAMCSLIAQNIIGRLFKNL